MIHFVCFTIIRGIEDYFDLFFLLLLFRFTFITVTRRENDIADWLFSKNGTYRESRKMSLRSKLARNMNMLLFILISVTELEGSEWPNATM
jgi:hypothetical protein